jgi:hypothetical protein
VLGVKAHRKPDQGTFAYHYSQIKQKAHGFGVIPLSLFGFVFELRHVEPFKPFTPQQPIPAKCELVQLLAVKKITAEAYDILIFPFTGVVRK